MTEGNSDDGVRQRPGPALGFAAGIGKTYRMLEEAK